MHTHATNLGQGGFPGHVPSDLPVAGGDTMVTKPGLQPALQG